MAFVYDSLTKDAPSAAASLSAMMEKEQTVYSGRRDYLRSSSTPSDATLVTETDRTKIVDWCYNIIDTYQFDRETVAVAMDMTDRFLSIPSRAARQAWHDHKDYQLVAMAALYTSIKVREKVTLGSDFFSAMSWDTYTVQEIEATERAILSGLQWRIHAPTGLQVANHILSLVLTHLSLSEKIQGFILDEVMYQTEHAVRDYYFATQRPSTVASAAIFNALDQVDTRIRRAILGIMLLFVNDDFASPDILFAAKNQLRSLVQGNDAMEDEQDQDTAIMSDETRPVEVHKSVSRMNPQTKHPGLHLLQYLRGFRPDEQG